MASAFPQILNCAKRVARETTPALLHLTATQSVAIAIELLLMWHSYFRRTMSLSIRPNVIVPTLGCVSAGHSTEWPLFNGGSHEHHPHGHLHRRCIL